MTFTAPLDLSSASANARSISASGTWWVSTRAKTSGWAASSRTASSKSARAVRPRVAERPGERRLFEEERPGIQPHLFLEHAQDHDATAGRDRGRGVEQRVGVAADGLDHQRERRVVPDLRAAANRRRIERRGGAQLARDARLVPVPRRDRDVGRTPQSRHRDRENPDRPGAEHQQRVARVEAAESQPVHAHRDRLGQRRDPRVELGRHGVEPAGRRHQSLGEASRTVQPDQPVLGTAIVEARGALLATAAGEERLDRGAIADPPARDTLAHRVDHADELVAQRHPGAHAIGLGVEDVEIGAAESARFDAQAHLTRAWLGHRDRLRPHLALATVDTGEHLALRHRLRPWHLVLRACGGSLGAATCRSTSDAGTPPASTGPRAAAARRTPCICVSGTPAAMVSKIS